MCRVPRRFPKTTVRPGRHNGQGGLYCGTPTWQPLDRASQSTTNLDTTAPSGKKNANHFLGIQYRQEERREDIHTAGHSSHLLTISISGDFFFFFSFSLLSVPGCYLLTVCLRGSLAGSSYTFGRKVNSVLSRHSYWAL